MFSRICATGPLGPPGPSCATCVRAGHRVWWCVSSDLILISDCLDPRCFWGDKQWSKQRLFEAPWRWPHMPHSVKPIVTRDFDYILYRDFFQSGFIQTIPDTFWEPGIFPTNQLTHPLTHHFAVLDHIDISRLVFWTSFFSGLHFFRNCSYSIVMTLHLKCRSFFNLESDISGTAFSTPGISEVGGEFMTSICVYIWAFGAFCNLGSCKHYIFFRNFSMWHFTICDIFQFQLISRLT